MMATGKVVLVGAGPGHPGLLTGRGRQAIEQADAIVFDRLASPRILAYAKPEAKLIYVGKTAKHHTLSQSEIQDVLVSLAQRGLFVVRVKGGDPFVFGRGAEEARALSEAGVKWEVVPGVTSAVAVPAYAGIPVTLRDVSPSFSVMTGHRSDSEEPSLEHDGLLRGTGTLIVLMGVAHLPDIVERLISSGRSPHTPVALVRWGTRAEQTTIVGTLANIVDVAAQRKVTSPAVIVVGDVVKERDHLAWFEQLPLFGKRVLAVASTTNQAMALATVAETAGAETYVASMEQLAAPNRDALSDFWRQCQTCAARVGVFFTTSFGVRTLFEDMRERGMDARQLHRLVIGASNPFVDETLRSFGLLADVSSREQMTAAGVDLWWTESAEWLESAQRMDGTEEIPDRRIADKAAVMRRLPLLTRRQPHVDPDAAILTWRDLLHTWAADGIDFAWVASDAVNVLDDLGLSQGEFPVLYAKAGVMDERALLSEIDEQAGSGVELDKRQRSGRLAEVHRR